MKITLTACLVSTAVALSAFAQIPASPPALATSPAGVAASPAAPAMTPAVAPAQPGAPVVPPAAPVPGAAGVPPGGDPAVPGAPAMAPATGAPAVPGAATSPAAPGAPAPAPGASEADAGFWTTNNLLEQFNKGGWIMWPILVVSITALAVVIERVGWWLMRWTRRDPKRIEKVFTAIETGDVAEASRLSRGSRDPVLRMIWNGLNHQHASLQGALQVAAGIEIKRAGRFLVVMDTLVTLAPLLGLLGTITGLMRSFAFLGNDELAVSAVTGGIAEALIATAAGLGIAIFALIPFNFFTSRVSNLEFELQTAATNLEVMLEANAKAKHEVEMSSRNPQPVED